MTTMQAGTDDVTEGNYITMTETYELQAVMRAFQELANGIVELSVGSLAVYDSNGDLLGTVNLNHEDESVFYPYKGA
jgi:hypothetical protein